MEVDSIAWLVLVLILILDLLFSSLRSSFLNVRVPMLLNLKEKNPKKLEATLALLERRDLRASLRLAAALAHFLLAASVLWLCLFYLTPQITSLGIFLAAAAGAAIFFLICEFALEGLTLRNPEIWVMRLTPIARAVEFLLRPFATLLTRLWGSPAFLERPLSIVTDDELRNWVQVDQSTSSLEKDEREMIYSIFHFGDTLCREIMVPRMDVLALDVSTPLEEAVSALLHSGHSRVPVYEESIDNVIGLLYAKDLLSIHFDCNPVTTIRQHLRSAYFVPEAKKVADLLREMQLRSIHMAIVVDEYGGTAGIVTLEDIVEEIIGEIRDEYDESEELDVQETDEGIFRFSGRINIDDLNEILSTHLSTEQADTLGGYIFSTLGKVPLGGEQFQVEDWLFTVEQITGRRIRAVTAQRVPVQNSEEEQLDDSKR